MLHFVCKQHSLIFYRLLHSKFTFSVHQLCYISSNVGDSLPTAYLTNVAYTLFSVFARPLGT